jgi:hypothetical protein
MSAALRNSIAVFIADIKYPSLFVADLDSGIRSVSIWKALHKSHGNPAMAHGAFVALESRIRNIPYGGKGEKMKKYMDFNGNIIFVRTGLGGEKWMSWRFDGRRSPKRVKTKLLPERDTEKEALADLDAYAERKGWKEAD